MKIQQPEEGNLYLFGEKILPTLLGNTIVFGPIDVHVGLFQDDIEKVEFYVDWWLRSTDITPPYSWTWNYGGLIRHRHTLKVVAYNSTGRFASDQIKVWRFF